MSTQLSWAQPEVKAPPFALDAASDLIERGILEGYPDKSSNPGQAVTRNELVQILSRVERLLEEQHQEFASGASLSLMRTALREFREDLIEEQRRVRQVQERL